MEINTAEINNILIIQSSPFGDVLLNTGYLPFLREKFPDAHIDFRVSRPFHTIIEHNENIDELVLYDKNLKGLAYIKEGIRIIREVRRRKYDLVIDQNRATRSAQIVLFSGAHYRIGFTNFTWRFVYNIKVTPDPARYSASAKFDLSTPLGISEQSYHLHYHVTQQSFDFIDQWIKINKLCNTKWICVAPGSPRT
jgi:ADP-heptose:LPS heptosyltransferase